MPRFRHQPAAQEISSWGDVQSVELLDGREAIARATWQPLPGVPGAYQLLWAQVAEPVRRRGHGSHLLNEAVRQAALHARSAGQPLRRFIVLIEQPNLIARAWLARNGFLHVNTLNDVSAKGELLVMIKTFT